MSWVPAFPGRVPYLMAGAIDALGNGFFAAFSLLFFRQVTGLPMAEIGFGLSVAFVATLLASPAVGAGIDRFGAKRMLVAGNLLSATGFAGYLVVDDLPLLIAAATLASLGNRVYYPGSSALIGDLVTGRDRDALVAVRSTVLMSAVGLGGLASGLAVGFGGYQVVAIVQVVSYTAAAALLLRVAVAGPARSAAPGAGGPGLLTVLRDRRFMAFIVISLPISFAQDVFIWALPLYAGTELHMSPPVIGALSAWNTALSALTQLPVSRLQRRSRRTRGAALGALLYAVAFAAFGLAGWLPGAITLGVATTIYVLAERVQLPPLEALKISMAPVRLRGRYMAAYSMLCGGLTAAVAPLLFTLALSVSPLLLWSVLGTGVLASAVGYLWLGEQPELESEAATAPAGHVTGNR
ncbi:MFS transporter [Nonomuraea sp. NPDC003804]|uniref:MFS transporter n=1 Tax=Nonomuraea sp. NPDC003804 TaxID=3154547 RepID=UPI0033A363A8